jgi:hypothetical protein
MTNFLKDSDIGTSGHFAHLKVASLEPRKAIMKTNNNLFFEESTKRVCRQGRRPF